MQNSNRAMSIDGNGNNIDLLKLLESMNSENHSKIKLLMDISRSPRSQSQIDSEIVNKQLAMASINQIPRENI